MSHTEAQFSSKDGSSLYLQRWTPDHEPEAVIAIVHGAGEHSGRYHNLVEYFLDRDFALYGFDFRGHGRSAGRVGHVMSWQEYREDLHAYLQIIRDDLPTKSLFIYAHSMGGQIVLDYLTQNGTIENSKTTNGSTENESTENVENQRHRTQNDVVELAGVITSSPALAQPGLNPLLMQLGKALALIWPGASLSNGLDLNAISRDPDAVRAYREDPLVSSRVSARFGAEFMACIERVQSNAGRLQVPLYMFHGDADRIIPVAGTPQFFDKVEITDKKLKIYPGGFHELHNDLQQQEVFRDVECWLNDHLPPQFVG